MDENKRIDPRVKDILTLLGAGTFLAASFLMPGLPTLLKIYEDEKRKQAKKEWEKYNFWRLRQLLRRLEKQKMVEVSGDVVKITDKGRQKFLKYQLEQMQLKRKTDGKWRLIIYDIANLRKAQREQFRKMLKRLKFLKLQESVYLTPFICEDEIEYIKQLFDISDEVKVLKVTGIENEDIYKRFFGL